MRPFSSGTGFPVPEFSSQDKRPFPGCFGNQAVLVTASSLVPVTSACCAQPVPVTENTPEILSPNISNILKRRTWTRFGKLVRAPRHCLITTSSMTSQKGKELT